MGYADFRHRMPLRVRWAEVDKQGVVFNGHYLLYCDVCVTEYWRAIGVKYPEDFAGQGADLFVRKATIDYHSAAEYDDELEVCGRIARIGGSSMLFVVEVYRRHHLDAMLVCAELIYVYVDLGSRQTTTVPEALRERIRLYETVAPQESTGAG